MYNIILMFCNLSCFFCFDRMILGSRDHIFHACMKIYDFLTRKTPKP